MSIFKCKMCGGTIEFNPGDTVGVCDSCGTKQTLPRLNDEKKANLYDRANHFRRSNDFDKAMGIYEQILNEDTTDAANHCYFVMPSDPTAKQWVYTIHPANYKPGATYHVEADVQIYSLGHDTDIPDGFRAEIICNTQYNDPAGNDHGVARTFATKGEWTHMSFDFTVSSKSKSRLNDRFTFYANPVDELGVGFLFR